jgi:hypothetical protein
LKTPLFGPFVVLRTDASLYSNAVPIAENRQKWTRNGAVGGFRQPRLGEIRQRSVGNIRHLRRVEAQGFVEEYE